MGDSCVETLDTRVVTPESVELRSPEPDPGQCCEVVTGKLSAGQIPGPRTSSELKIETSSDHEE